MSSGTEEGRKGTGRMVDWEVMGRLGLEGEQQGGESTLV